MKELSLEEKAKRYDEAIEIAKEINNEQQAQPFDVMTRVFPELKESEDERIRKAIISFLKSPFVNENITDEKVTPWIAWLEKQGGKDKFIEKELECIKSYREKAIKRLEELEKQGEQKPTDKVEPKFKIGDWIVCCDYEPEQIIGIKTNAYEMSNGDIRPFYMIDNNHNIRLWTIQDARDGDVFRIKNITFIFQEITNDNVCHKDAAVAHCSYEDNDDAFGISGPDCITDLELIHPATKEQRDLLFQKIKEEGYEWDAKKKELRKIEQKPAWSEEDEERFQSCIKILQTSDGYDTINTKWLKSLKDRVQPQPKQKWTEEDDSKLKEVLYYIEYVNKTNVTFQQRDLVHLINWLKSLRPRSHWKPSDEQMNALETAVSSLQSTALESLYQDLKRL